MNIISLPSGLINEPLAYFADANGLNYQATVLCDTGGVPITSSNPIPVSIISGEGSDSGDLSSIAATSASSSSALATISSTLQSQKFMTVWTDDTGAYFILQLAAGGSPTWTNTAGAASPSPGTGMRPASGVSAIVDATRYQATASGTGYSVNDFLSHIVTTDPTSGTVLGYFWLNVSTNLKLASAPLASNIVPITALPVGAAQDGTDATAAIQPSGGTGIRGWLSGIYSKLPSNPSTVIANRQLTTTSAVALPSQVLVNGVVIKALSTNVATVYVGPIGVTTATGYPLIAGEAISFGATNLNAIYIIGANGTDSVAFTGN